MKRLSALYAASLVVAMSGMGCSQAQHGYAIPDANVTLPPYTGAEWPMRRAGSPPELLAVQSGGNQVVLLRCTTSEDIYYSYRNWGRSFVLVLDGPLQKGRIEITPENGRLIENADWNPPRQPYVGLEGSINIVSVSKSGILAECNVHNQIRRTGEPVHSLRGMYLFDVGAGTPGVLRRCGIEPVFAPVAGEAR